MPPAPDAHDHRVLFDDDRAPWMIGVSLAFAVSAVSRFLLTGSDPAALAARVGKYFPVAAVALLFSLLRPLRTTVRLRGEQVELEVKSLFSGARHRFDRSQVKCVRFSAPVALEIVTLVTDEREFTLVKRLRYRMAFAHRPAVDLARELGVPFERG